MPAEPFCHSRCWPLHKANFVILSRCEFIPPVLVSCDCDVSFAFCFGRSFVMENFHEWSKTFRTPFFSAVCGARWNTSGSSRRCRIFVIDEYLNIRRAAVNTSCA